MFLTEEYLQYSMCKCSTLNGIVSTIILQRHQSWCVSLEREMLCVWGSATCQSCHMDLLHTAVSLQWRRPLWIKRQGPTGPVILSQRPQPWSQMWTEQNLDWKKEKQEEDGERHLVQERIKQSMQIPQNVAQESHTSLFRLLYILYIFIFTMWTQWN